MHRCVGCTATLFESGHSLAIHQGGVARHRDLRDDDPRRCSRSRRVVVFAQHWYRMIASLFLIPCLSGSSFATTLLATMVWFNARTALFRQNIKGFSFIQLHKRKMIAVVAASVAVDIIGGVLVVMVPVRVFTRPPLDNRVRCFPSFSQQRLVLNERRVSKKSSLVYSWCAKVLSRSCSSGKRF